jgi:hypothetical protein
MTVDNAENLENDRDDANHDGSPSFQLSADWVVYDSIVFSDLRNALELKLVA